MKQLILILAALVCITGPQIVNASGYDYWEVQDLKNRIEKLEDNQQRLCFNSTALCIL